MNASSLTGSKNTPTPPFDYCFVLVDFSSKKMYYFFPRTFTQTVGTFDELKKYLQGYVETLARDDKKRNAK